VKSNNQNPSVAIVIPIYQSALSIAEMASLKQCMHILADYPVKIVKPHALDLGFFKTKYPAIEFISFENEFFTGTAGYNRLLTSLEFYKTFISYEFILIYQLDAYVFKDELLDWCKKGYDYIGAPSLHQEEFNALQADSKNEYAKALSENRIVFNGGLSLRRIPAFIRYLKIYNTFYSKWPGNEDMLFSQEATRLIPMKLFLKLPAWQEALRFAFEKSPAATYQLIGNQLPFACHAWERYDPDFWSDYITIDS